MKTKYLFISILSAVLIIAGCEHDSKKHDVANSIAGTKWVMKDGGLKATWYFDSAAPTCYLKLTEGDDERTVHYKYTYKYPTVRFTPSQGSYAKLTGTIFDNNKMNVINAETKVNIGEFKLQ